MDAAGSTLQRAVLDAMHEVFDPELGYNIVDLGLVYTVETNAGAVRITMTMTTPGCPAQDYIVLGVRERVLQIPEVEGVDIELVWDPPWSPQKMSPEAKAYFQIEDTDS